MKTFDEGEVSADLDARLRKVGLDPLDAQTIKVKTIVSAYYAERTSEVLQKVQEVLSRFDRGERH